MGASWLLTSTSCHLPVSCAPGFHCYPELQKGYMLQATTVALAALGSVAEIDAPSFGAAKFGRK